MPRTLFALLTVASLLAWGCKTDDDDSAAAGDDDTTGDDDSADDDDTTPGEWDGGWPIELTIDGQALIDGSWDGEGPVWWALDTGAARTYADADLTGTSNFATGDLVVGPLEFPEMTVACTHLDEAEAFIGWDLGGLAGQDIFVDRFSALDYAGLEAHFMDDVAVEPPPGTTGDVFLSAYELPSSIPVMPARLGGAKQVEVDLIADTGSGVTILLQSFFDQIDDGTLPRLDGYIWGTNYGTDMGFVTRIPAIIVGDTAELSVDGTWAIVIPDDNHLWPLLEGNGIHCDGFIGYPFYRTMVVGVDGFADTYHWYPYTDLDHIDANEWKRVGIEPTWRDGGFHVEMLYTPSDAADQGLLPGDILQSLDGTDVATMTLDDVKRGLRGTPGDTVDITVTRDQKQHQFQVEIEDLLPEL